ncbi:MAG: 30S ribosomal protein S6 [Firmicutes bacterium]|uniref:Small ribosomal subunit protein bS6 n=1 Tax=Candidatus Onthovivens merdipullorum TaxID=2840889 RepID=A0A9D9GU70_9BACL|nr:30S ribosomal protein S6 [Candidatus Onthovivens merdipullorum]
MKKYEIMYILKADLDDASRTAEINKLHAILTGKGAKISKVDEWGVREFAYPINKLTKGYYVVVKVEADVNATKEFDRLAKIDSNVIRFLITIDRD